MLAVLAVGGAAAAIGYADKRKKSKRRADFDESGPVHLKDVNWCSRDDQRTVLASLVKGVYVLERDRQKKRAGARALAPRWWRFFHFQKNEVLIDEKDGSIYGAIYELEPQLQNVVKAPRFVIAFRGTLLKSECIVQDTILNFKILHQCFHRSERCESAAKAVEKMVFSERKHPISTKLWLAGHSLGSALAIHAGKKMAEKGALLKTFLFNPPFPSIFNEKPRCEAVKQVIECTNSILTGGAAFVLKDNQQLNKDEESFAKLSKWSPYVFVNRHDSICSRYITYFEQRKKMVENGAGRLGRVATQNSLRALLKNALGGSEEYNAFYLLPSAHLFIENEALSGSIFDPEDHKLRQWWRENSQLEHKPHHYSLLSWEGEEGST